MFSILLRNIYMGEASVDVDVFVVICIVQTPPLLYLQYTDQCLVVLSFADSIRI